MRAQDDKNLYVGDQLQIQISSVKQVMTHVEILQDHRIWAADFLRDIWSDDWRGQVFEARFLRGETVYSFLMEIEGRDIVEGLHLTRLLRVSDVDEVQRRSGYRLQHSFDVYMKKIGTDGDYEECNGFDVSEAGVGATSRNPDWREGDKVICRFVLGGEEYAFESKIVRRRIWTANDVMLYKLGVRFMAGNEQRLKQLRRYIFKQQVARKR